MSTAMKRKILRLAFVGCLIPAMGSLFSPTQTLSQINLGGDKGKKKEEEKPQFPHHKFKGVILTIKLEERRFLLDTTDGLAILVQVDDKTKIKHRKEKKHDPDVLFADLKKGDVVEVSGQLPPTRILQAEKIYVESSDKK